jgi:hypothetical protein
MTLKLVTIGGLSSDFGRACPTATQNIALNLKNRQRCIDTADYGPANPRLPNDAYWKRMAARWRIPVSEAKSMRCGNCAAFEVTRHVKDCIANGIGRDGIEPFDTIVAAELGYCRFFDFKCAASRTCRAWVVGGPIRDK